MSAASAKVLYLRQLLAETVPPSTFPDKVYQTELPALDEIGIPSGSLTEFVSSPAAGPGGGLLLYSLLAAAHRRAEPCILLDGKDSFAPRELPEGKQSRLLWVRSPHAAQAIKAADLVVRDGNIPLVIMWLALNPLSELRRISALAWQRLQLMAEKSNVALLVFTPVAQIGCARLRLNVDGAFPLKALHRDRAELVTSLRCQVVRQRRGTTRNPDEIVRRPLCA